MERPSLDDQPPVRRSKVSPRGPAGLGRDDGNSLPSPQAEPDRRSNDRSLSPSSRPERSGVERPSLHDQPPVRRSKVSPRGPAGLGRDDGNSSVAPREGGSPKQRSLSPSVVSTGAKRSGETFSPRPAAGSSKQGLSARPCGPWSRRRASPSVAPSGAGSSKRGFSVRPCGPWSRRGRTRRCHARRPAGSPNRPCGRTARTTSTQT